MRLRCLPTNHEDKQQVTDELHTGTGGKLEECGIEFILD